MVDPIGVKTVTVTDVGSARVSTAAVPTPVAAPSPVATADIAETEASALAKTMAAAAPVDSDRVEEIRKAIANGTFPILPATIADQLMALRLDWIANDQA